MSQLFVDNIKNRTGGAIGAPSGAVVTGIVTATGGSFSGKESVGGVLTYEDVTSIDSVGIITAQSGIRVNAGGLVVAGVSTLAADLSIADKIIHTGDPNTAIRFPAADTFTVETTGSERLRIDSDGKILSGIATARGNLGNNASGVEAQVQIEGTSFTSSTFSVIRNSADANDGGIIIGKTRSATAYGNAVVVAGDALGSLTWAGSDGTSLQFGAEIVGEVQSGVGNDDLPTDLIFKTNGGTTSTTERLRITSAGLIGIGAITPSVSYGNGLHIAGGNAGLKLQNTNNGDWAYIEYADESNTTKFIQGYRDQSGVYGIRPGTSLNATPGISLTSAGFIGINDSSASRALAIKYNDNTAYSETASTPANGVIKIFNESTTAGCTAGEILFGARDGGTGYASISGISPGSQEAELAFRVMDGATFNEALRLDKSANATFSRTESDSLGPVRRVKVDPASTGFTLTAAYAGQLVRQSGSGQTIHFPNGVFSAGDMVSFFNVGTGTLTITAAGTMHNTADGNTGNRTIAAKGMATVICTASNEFAISGTQLT